MKFENLMYDGKIIKIVVDLDEVFIEHNDDKDYSNDNSDTLDLTNISMVIDMDKGDYHVK